MTRLSGMGGRGRLLSNSGGVRVKLSVVLPRPLGLPGGSSPQWRRPTVPSLGVVLCPPPPLSHCCLYIKNLERGVAFFHLQ